MSINIKNIAVSSSGNPNAAGLKVKENVKSVILPNFIFSESVVEKMRVKEPDNRKKDIISQKKLFYKKIEVWNNYKFIMVSIATVMCIHWVSPIGVSFFDNYDHFPNIKWNVKAEIKYPIFCVVLLVLPFCRTSKHQPVFYTMTALFVVVTVIQLEILFERPQSMVTYLVLTIMFRIFENRTFFDNLALSIAYTADVTAINRAAGWYYSSNVFLWTFLLVAFLLAHMYKRASMRIWEHIRVLIILKEKTGQELVLGDLLASAHMPDDMVSHLFPSTRLNSTAVLSSPLNAAQPERPAPNAVSPVNLLGSNISNGRAYLKADLGSSIHLPPDMPADVKSKVMSAAAENNYATGFHALQNNKRINDSILRAASQEILTTYTDSCVTVEQLDQIGGLDNRFTVIIAIKPDWDLRRQCWLNNMREYDFMALVDHVAIEHRVTRVRMVGSTWVGCIGVFQQWESEGVSVHHGLQFACEVSTLAKEQFGKVSLAMDCGNITGGFLSNSLNFEFFGPEIRFCLMAVEMPEHYIVALGDRARNQLTTYRKEIIEQNRVTKAELEKAGMTANIPSIKIFDLEQRMHRAPWKLESIQTVNYMVNVDEHCDREFLLPRVREFHEIVELSYSDAGQLDRTVGRRSHSLYTLLNTESLIKRGPRSALDWTTIRRMLEEDDGLTDEQRNQQNLAQCEKDRNRKKAGGSAEQSRRNHANSQRMYSQSGTYSLPEEYNNIETRMAADHRLLDPNPPAIDLRDHFSKPLNCHTSELGIEFQTTLYERLGVRLDDPVLDKYSDETLEEMHDAMLSEVVAIIKRECFPTAFSMAFQISKYTNILGCNEYPVMADPQDSGKVGPHPDESNKTTVGSVKTMAKKEGTYVASLKSATPTTNDDDLAYGNLADSWHSTNWLKYRFFTFKPEAKPEEIIPGLLQEQPKPSRRRFGSATSGGSVHSSTEEVSEGSSFRGLSRKPKPSSSVLERVSRYADSIFSFSRTNSATRLFDTSQSVPEMRSRPQQASRFRRTGSVAAGTRYSVAGEAAALDRTAPISFRRNKPATVPDVSWWTHASSRIKDIVNQLTQQVTAVCQPKSGQVASQYQSLDNSLLNSTVFQRSWEKYSSDCLVYVHNSQLCLLIDAFFALVTWYALVPAYNSSRSQNFSLLLDMGVLHFLVPAILERRFDKYLFFFLVTVRVIFFYVLPAEVLCNNPAIAGANAMESAGDLGGDTTFLLLIAFRIGSQARQPIMLSLIDVLLMRVVSLKFWFTSPCGISSPARLLSTCFSLNLLVMYQLLRHRSFVSYIIEHKLIPFAVESHKRQKQNTRNLLRKFAPDVPVQPSCDLFLQKNYRSCAIASLHIKASDLLSGFVDSTELEVILNRINIIIDSAIVECGMLKVSQFSGVVIAVMPRDSTLENVKRLRKSLTYTERAVVLMRKIQQQMEQYSREFDFHLSVGIAITLGEANLGFLGNKRFCYDISGAVTGMAVCMASYHRDGIFASSAYQQEIYKVTKQPGDAEQDPFEKHKSAQVPYTTIMDAKQRAAFMSERERDEQMRSSDHCWLRIDGNLSGMQLDDFMHIGMLGKGGYGSVHLVQEKYTNANYAIKAVHLKNGSMISKMIARECSILQMMAHPNVVSLLYAFVARGRLYMVMPVIRGGSLRQVLDSNPTLNITHMTLWFAELVLALEYVHAIGIIHRDVKPANCMIGTDGHLQLADFGLSKVVECPLGVVPAIVSDSFDEDEEQPSKGMQVMGMAKHVYQKMQKFLPLKLNIASAKVQSSHRYLRVIALRTRMKRHSVKWKGVTFEIEAAETLEEALKIIHHKYIDGIFCDVDPRKVSYTDSAEVVAREMAWDSVAQGVEWCERICKENFNSLPVWITSQKLDVEEYRDVFVKAGARDMLADEVRFLEEKTVRRLFGLATYITDTAPLMRSAANSVAGGSFHGNSFGATSMGQKMSLPSHSTRHSNRTEKTLAESVNVTAMQHSVVGTMFFIAPEAISSGVYGKPVDWWALGHTIFNCLTNGHVFNGLTKEEIANNILTMEIDLQRLDKFGPALKSLVASLLTRDVKQRLGTDGAKKVKEHLFFVQQGIMWDCISDCDPDYKPPAFITKKFDPVDAAFFYGDPEATEEKIFVCEGNGLGSSTRCESGRRSHRRARKRNVPTPNYPNKYALMAQERERRERIAAGAANQEGQQSAKKSAQAPNGLTEMALVEGEEEEENSESGGSVKGNTKDSGKDSSKDSGKGGNPPEGKECALAVISEDQ